MCAETKSLVCKSVEEFANNPQYCRPWIVLDKDEEQDFDKLVQEAKNNNISVAWSNPCFEIFLHGYFGRPKITNNSKQCCSNFKTQFKKKCGIEYKKSMSDLYKKLNEHGDEMKAIDYARQCHIRQKNGSTPSEMIGVSLVYQLVEELKNKKI